MFPPNTETEARVSTLSLTFNIVSEFPISVIGKKKKYIETGKEK